MDLGANRQHNGEMRFRVWAPLQPSLSLKIGKRVIPMQREEKGYFTATLLDCAAGTLYTYLLPNGEERADPVSRSLPKGVEGPTEIIDPEAFLWSDRQWKKAPFDAFIFYECHVGTFTEEGTFKGVIKKLPYLKDLGINCLELMPLATFPGRCNWGYDGVSLYAPHPFYGGATQLKELVNACHEHEIHVALDVVYNHFGPSGAYLTSFGPYLTEKYKTPWGKALNYDGPGSDEVKHFMLQNALYWVEEYHIDVLRLDALHALFDQSPNPFLHQLACAIGTKAYLIGENDLNDSRLIRPKEKGGVGFQGWWSEDFHHALHVAFTQEQQGYYSDYHGTKDVRIALQKGVIYQNKYSTFRMRSHGNTFRGIKPSQLIVFAQNHDQIGNRPFGDRLSSQLTFENQKLLAFLLILSPYTPLLFMGQEYGEDHPFEYFVDHPDPMLMQAIFEGRKKEFGLEEIPMPDFAAYERSKLSWRRNEKLLRLYQKLIQLRGSLSRKKFKVSTSKYGVLAWEYEESMMYCNFSKGEQEIEIPHRMTPALHTEQEEFGGKHPVILEEDRATLPESCGIFFKKMD